MSFMNIFNEIMNDKSGNLFLQSPIMFQDMIRTHSSYRDCVDFNKLQRPMLRVTGGNPYTLDDIYTGLITLYNQGIKSFILLENSTYTLNLLINLFEINKISAPFSVSTNENFIVTVRDRWGKLVYINGVVISLNSRKGKINKSLPADVIV